MAPTTHNLSTGADSAKRKNSTSRGAKKQPSPVITFTAKNRVLESLVAAHQLALQKSILTHAGKMLTITEEIHGRRETRNKFDDTEVLLANKQKLLQNFLDTSVNTFIPVGERGSKEKTSLNCSKKAKEDGRRCDALVAIKVLQQEDETIMRATKTFRAINMGLLAEQELIGAQQALCIQFCDSLQQLAKYLVLKGQSDLEYTATLDIKLVAFAAVSMFVKSMDGDFWIKHNFFRSDKADEAKEKFYQILEAHIKINYEKDIKPTIDDKNETWGTGDYHPDSPLIASVIKDLEVIIPAITTDYWGYHASIQKNKKLQAALLEEIEKDKIDEQNEALESAMDVDPTEHIASFVDSRIQANRNSEIARRQNEARKKSTDDAEKEKNQASKSTTNGPKQSNESSGKNGKHRGRHRHRSPKRPHEYSEEEDQKQYHRSRSKPRTGGNLKRGRETTYNVHWREGSMNGNQYHQPYHHGRGGRGHSPHYREHYSHPQGRGRGRGGGRGGYNSGGRGRGRGRNSYQY